MRKYFGHRYSNNIGVITLILIFTIFFKPLIGSAQSAQIIVVSNPPGADVFVGAKSIDRIVRFETGRWIGQTPITTFLTNYDISMEGENQSNAIIYVEVKKNGYIPHATAIDLGEYGRLDPNKTYKIEINFTN